MNDTGILGEKNSGDLKKGRFYLMDDLACLDKKKKKKFELYDLRSLQFRWKLFQRENSRLTHENSLQTDENCVI